MIMYKAGFVYITCSPNRNVLYTGVTSDLKGRIWEHRNKIYPDSFSAKYNCIQLVYYNQFDSIAQAIAEEKRLKAGNRRQKERLINTMNKDWRDLWEDIEQW